MNIYNISAKESFVDVLAERFLQKYENRPEELSKILFLLPNRRACQNLADAFVRLRGMKPTILPRIEPTADVEEDEIFLSGSKELLDKLKPSISNMERVLIFTRMIMQRPDFGAEKVSLSQAYALAENLADLIDTVQNEELDFSRLKDIVPDNYSDYWRKTLKFLEIITTYWPQILIEKNCCDESERKKQLLKAEIDLWKSDNNRPQIVIAGSTAAFPVLKELVKTVAEFDNGEVYLYGLDKYADDFSWQSSDENHPQYELKELLNYLGISRDSVMNIGSDETTAREKLVSEIMRPALSTGAWRDLSAVPLTKDTFDNIHLINCDDMRHEAKTIALIMRDTLETKEKTVALVTSDRNLSRRVISELKKWGINADDSAGQPLSLTAIGIYFRLIAETLIQDSLAAKIALMKHPFTSCGLNHGDMKQQVYKLELDLRKENELTAQQTALLKDFDNRISPLKKLYENGQADLKDLLVAHIKVAENLADTNLKNGDAIIWKGDAGHAAAEFFAEFINECEILGKVAVYDYLPFLVSILSKKNVRLRYGFHPRVKILGAIEARLSMYDTVIIGEVNEGIWPNIPKADMWLSRPMKKTFGMSQAERSIGICAADFAHLLNAPKVYLTRAQKIDGVPSDKSRWWLRLETVLKAVFREDNKEYEFIYEQPYSFWAKNKDRCDNPQPIKAPHPRPEVKYRPRKLSASKVEILMRDPYAIYAKDILGLQPLPELDRPKEVYDFGNIIHEMLDEFNKKYDGKDYPQDAAEQLMNMGLKKFSENNIGEEVQTFWRPRLKSMIDMIVNQEEKYRADLQKIFSEVKGEMKFNGTAGPFLITAKADRIDVTKDKNLNVIDYKTGYGRHAQEIEKGTAPQLPIEAMIAQEVGFEGVPKLKVASMQYWALKGKSEATGYEQSQKAILNIKKAVQTLIDEFDKKERPYLAKPIQGGHGQYGDYDHLSRFLEWSVRDDGEDNGG